MKKIAAAALGLLVLLSFGCRNHEPLRIGFVGSLTGNFSSVGLSSRNAVLLAIEETNERGGIGGRPLELVIRDDQADPERTRTQVEELIDEGVIAIFGPTTTSSALKIQDLFSKEGPVFLSSTVSTTALDGIDDNLFKFITATTRKDKITTLLLDYHNIEKLIVVNDLTNDEFAHSYINEFKPEYTRRGGVILDVVSYTPREDSAYKDTAEQILDRGPQGIIFLGDERNTALLCQQLKIGGYEGFMFTNAMTQKILDHGGTAVEGLMMISTFDPSSEDSAYLSVKKAYEERFSMDMNFAVKRAYEAATVFIDALYRDPGAADLKGTILAKSSYPGLQGDLNMNSFGDVERKMFMFRLHNGNLEVLEEAF